MINPRDLAEKEYEVFFSSGNLKLLIFLICILLEQR